MLVPDGQLFEFKAGPPGQTNLAIVHPGMPPQPGWGDRWNDLTNWWKSGKEGKPAKKPAAESADVFDKGRDLWYTIIGSKSSPPAQPKKPAPVSSPQKGVPVMPDAVARPTQKTAPPAAETKPVASSATPIAPKAPSADVARTASVPPPQPSAPVAASPVTRPETWIFQIGTADTKPLADAFRQRFFAHGFEAQMIHQRSAWLVQGKRSRVAEQQIAATILIEVSGINLKISIGSGKCVAGSFNSSEVISGDLNAVMSIAFSQAMLHELWNVTQSFVSFCGGKRIG